MAFTKPVKIPRWADTTLNILEPSEVKKDEGWLFGEVPPSAIENWRAKLLGSWIKWLDERLEDGVDENEFAIVNPETGNPALKINYQYVIIHEEPPNEYFPSIVISDEFDYFVLSADTALVFGDPLAVNPIKVFRPSTSKLELISPTIDLKMLTGGLTFNSTVCEPISTGYTFGSVAKPIDIFAEDINIKETATFEENLDFSKSDNDLYITNSGINPAAGMKHWCKVFNMYNNTGVSISAGKPVVLVSTTNDRMDIALSNSIGDKRLIGITAETIGIASAGRVVVGGLYKVAITQGTPAIGEHIGQSVQQGQLTDLDPTVNWTIGQIVAPTADPTIWWVWLR